MTVRESASRERLGRVGVTSIATGTAAEATNKVRRMIPDGHTPTYDVGREPLRSRPSSDPPPLSILTRLRVDLVEMTREQAEYAELLRALIRRDLSLRYRNAVMGFGWAAFMPLLQMVIFTLVFTRVATLDVGMPYPVYAYGGLLAWTMTASAIRAAAASLTSNQDLVTKVYFPREVLPFSAVLVALVDFAVASVVMVLLMAYYGVGVGWSLLLLPVVVVVHVAFTAGLALLVAMGHLFYADVKYVFELVLLVWMFASSVLYPIDRVGGALGVVMRLNPMTPIIEAYRDVVLRNTIPQPGPFVAVAAVSLLTLAVGWLVFHRAEFRFAEEI
jgi:lipopolysaccharide transport system permease protein